MRVHVLARRGQDMLVVRRPSDLRGWLVSGLTVMPVNVRSALLRGYWRAVDETAEIDVLRASVTRRR